MVCDCSFTCTWILYPYYLVVAYLLRAGMFVIATIASFKGSRFMTRNYPPDCSLKLIPSSKGKNSIRVNVYHPSYMAELESEKQAEKLGKKEKYPVHINMHGSGFVVGSFFESDSEYCRYISKKTGAIVLDCDYAKAPEHPFPAAYEDISDIVAYVLTNEQGNYDISRITIGGFSAGAALALCISATMPKDTFKAVTAFYPVINLDLKSHPNAPPPPPGQAKLNSTILQFFYKAYIPHTISRSDPRLSPHNSTASAFPNKVLLVACECDPLHDEAIDFGKMLKAGGKDVVVMDVPGVGHGWDKDVEDGTEAGDKRLMAYDRAVEVLRAAYQY